MTRHQPSPGEHPAGAAGQEASTTEPVVERTVQVAARASAATPGPWGYLRPWGVICAPDLSDVAHCLHDPDALFIAHARTDIPWLLDQLAAEQAAQLALEREQRELDGPGWVAVPRGWDRQLGLVLGHLGLSLAAKGAHVLARTRPPGAVLTRAELFAAGPDPVEAVDHALAELIALGLARPARPGRGNAREHGGITLTREAGQ